MTTRPPRELLGHTGVSLAIRLAGIAVNFLALLVLARTLDAGELGLWSWATELIALACAVAGLGFNMIAIRVVPDCLIGRERARLIAFLRAGLMASVLGSAALGLLALLAMRAGWLVPGIDAGTLGLMLLILLAFAATRFLQEVMRGAGRIVLAQIGEQLGLPLVLLGAAIGLWLVPGEGRAMPILLSVQALLFCALAAVLGLTSAQVARSILLPDDSAQARAWSGDWLAGGLPLAMCAALSVLLRRGDLIALGALGTAQDVAFYTPASRYSALLVLGQAAASMAAAGRMRGFWRYGEMAGLQHWLDQMAAISVLFALPLCAVFWLVPETLLGLFGADYAAAAVVLQVLACAQLVNCWTGPVAGLVVAAGLERVFTLATACCAGLLLALLALLVPRWGMMGAALSSLIAIAALNLVMVAIIRRRTGLVCWARPAAILSLVLAPVAVLQRRNAR